MPEESPETLQEQIVSSEDEDLILVDEEDHVVGYLSKGACHDGEGVLHRAFSIFIFDDKGRLLLQQRSAEKRLWGGFWSNTCCSHPRRGEILAGATHRRLEQELGMRAELHFLFKFSYHAPFGDAGSEREVCSVYVGRAGERPRPNVHEISDWRWVEPGQLDHEIEEHPDRFTPWFKEEWPRVRESYRSVLGFPA